MTATAADAVQLHVTPSELTLLEHALRSYESDFGHDEADVLHAIKALITKIEAAATS